MAKRIFSTDLSVKGIENLKKRIVDYRDNFLPSRCQELVRKLAESGILVAKQNVGNLGKYITFSIKTEQDTNGCKAIMLATNTGIIQSEWQTKDGVKSADVSPLLMVEFGSGLRAENPLNVPDVGTGTFPGQTHAEDPSGWWWMDMDGEWHHSYGMTPKMPMYKATMEMHTRVISIAREVFGR